MSRTASVLDFGVAGDGRNSDNDSALQSAFDSLRPGDTLVFPPGSYAFGTTILLATPDISLIFEDCTFLIGDGGRPGRISNGALGPIGFLFQDAHRLNLRGAARLVGQGRRGATKLAGMVFDLCNRVNCLASFHFENMAFGRVAFWCDAGRFGAISARHMNGRQTFGSASAGSAQVVVGCKNCEFDTIDARDNHKPVLYLSVAPNARNQAISNEDCRFGAVTGTAASGSAESALAQIRSAKNCHIESLSGTGFVNAAIFQLYDTDAGHVNDGNVIGSITGTFPSTNASTDAAVQQFRTPGAPRIGINHIRSIDVRCAGEYGLFASAGELRVDRLSIKGGRRSIGLFDATLTANEIVLEGQVLEAILVGQSARLTAGRVDIRSGPSGGAGSAIRYNPSFGGSGGFGSVSIRTIRYNRNGVGSDVNDIVWDETNGPTAWDIHDIQGTGSLAQARFAGAENRYSIRNGRISKPAVPTAGDFTVGDIIWNSAHRISDGGRRPSGWVRVTDGRRHVLGVDWAPLYPPSQ